jgi:flagellar basal body-associated protein FliL
MAKEKPAAAPAPASGSKFKMLLIVGVIAVVCCGAGFALPYVIGGSSSDEGSEPGGSHGASSHGAGHGSSGGHGGGRGSSGGHGGGHGAKPGHKPEPGKPAFVPFGEAVVNLHVERLTRYIRVKVVIEVDETKEFMVNDLVGKRKARLKSWLISYLADRTMEEVRGAAGVNRIRREIRDYFNNDLFPDGSELIRDIYFEEFTVQ